MYLVFTIGFIQLFVQNDEAQTAADQFQQISRQGVGVRQGTENAPTKHHKHFSKQKALLYII